MGLLYCGALACFAGCVAALPTAAIHKKELIAASRPPIQLTDSLPGNSLTANSVTKNTSAETYLPLKKPLARGSGWIRTTADHEPHQHFMPPPNHHLPERMSYAEFLGRFVQHNLSIHDPASQDYKPFALPPPSIRPGASPRDVFDWCVLGALIALHPTVPAARLQLAQTERASLATGWTRTAVEI